MDNSQGTERERLIMVIKSRTYIIGSKWQEFPDLKLHENMIFGCGHSTKELTRSRDQKSTKFLQRDLLKRIKEEQDNTNFVDMNL